MRSLVEIARSWVDCGLGVIRQQACCWWDSCSTWLAAWPGHPNTDANRLVGGAGS